MYKRLLTALIAICCSTPSFAQQVTITPPPAWRTCAVEGAVCASRAGALVRYGAGSAYVHRIVNGAVKCDNATFSDPAFNVPKSCSIASPAAASQPPSPAATPTPVATHPADPRAKLGVNVAGLAYWSGEQSFANQATTLEWRDPAASWAYVAAERIRGGVPASIEAGHPLTAALTPPAGAYRGEDATTRCTWKGTGQIGVSEARRLISRDAQSLTFAWPKTTTTGSVRIDLIATSASDPVRDIDCREPGETGIFAAQLLDYLKPFGVLRFLDWSNANGNPASVTWATRGQPGANVTGGTDGFALEYQIGLANAASASPWFTVPLNADVDYQRRMAQMVHDQVPSGRPVYVELSNETWNYQFGQAQQVQREGVAAKLSSDSFQAAQYRYAQRVIDMMAIWSQVYADRPRDLVRVVATMADNAWVGGILMDWNGGALRSSVDAIAIAPYFSVDLSQPGDPVARLSEAARAQIAVKVTAYAALAKRTGKRLIAYEAGQHLVDPAHVDLMKTVNRDPAMQAIYSRYLADWSAVSGGDLMTLYAATGPITKYGAWGLREYAGQPLAETPKLRGATAK